MISTSHEKKVNHSHSALLLPWLIFQLHHIAKSVLLVIFYSHKPIIYITHVTFAPLGIVTAMTHLPDTSCSKVSTPRNILPPQTYNLSTTWHMYFMWMKMVLLCNVFTPKSQSSKHMYQCFQSMQRIAHQISVNRIMRWSRCSSRPQF
jgi:hypothetical protein